ncbi:MAG TPA: hypothetical protein VIG50_11165, partial [Vicinamibacteria bacterium]
MLLAVLAAAAAVTQADPPRPLPEFRADVRVIRLDVSVVDKRGRPLAGLSPEQFTVLEDGRPVEITYFEAVDARSGAVTGPDSAVVVEAPPPRR